MRIFRTPSVLFLGVLWLLIGGLLLWWPITLTDTDLWYHLSGGRYVFTHHAIPHHSFFSFLTPPRTWQAHYFWLFQVAVYQLYLWWGYYGLIFFRTAAFLVTTGLVIRYLLRDVEDPRWLSWWAFLGMLYCLILFPRHFLVRPHLVSFMCMAAFLYVLEYRPRWVWSLPLIALLWCNFHGIEYPIMLLIVGAYGVEAIANRLRRRADPDRWGWRFLTPMLFTAAPLLLPPHGLRLLPVPFQPLGRIFEYIGELSPVTLDQVLSFHISMVTPSMETIFSCFLVITGLVVLSSLARRTVRLSHLILWGGGVLLLTLGRRFGYEYALLSLPLLKANPLCSPKELGRALPRPAQLAVVIALIVMPLLQLKAIFRVRPPYPFSAEGLPQGVMTFLNRINVGGKVLNQANLGGYHQWMLYPNYQIFMDMEVGPLGFSAEDFYVGGNVFQDRETLRKVLTQYDPSFIMVPYGADKFPELIKAHPDYVVVFFDDVEVLYANRRHYPELAAQDALADVDPFHVSKAREDEISSDPDQEPVLRHLPRLLAIYPQGGVANYVAGIVCLKEGWYDRALAHAQMIVRHYPQRAVGYELQGDAYKGLGKYEEAAASYRVGLDVSGGASKFYTKLGSVYLADGRSRAAYHALKQGADLFNIETPMEDLYELAVAARSAGHLQDAAEVLHHLAAHRVAADDEVWQRRVAAELALVEAQRALNGS